MGMCAPCPSPAAWYASAVAALEQQTDRRLTEAGSFCHIFLIELLVQYLTWTSVQCAVYLALSLPPIVFPTRQVLDFWLPGRNDKRPLLRKIFLIAVGTVLAMS